ncbi:MAG: LuxR C-terminal-related transcriptional regulator [Treponema sp.]|jgi:LuxR family maltose regulon positive regulatory protein|nr:LuxR C-terminal-related transcriptional regulator [Treponema sp.]
MHRLLEQAVQNPLVMVVAGAGYGKTYGVYSFVQTQGYRTVWMQLSARDNNPERFWEHFVQAAAYSNEEWAAQLEAVGFPKTNRQFDWFISTMQSSPMAHEKYMFVYDDVHLLYEKAVLGFLERFFNVPFMNSTFVLISRTKPAINTVNFFARGLLAQITEEDLRFNLQETLDYFQLQGIIMPSRAAMELYYDTEGWIFALQIAGLSLKQGTPVADYGRSSMRSNIYTLIEERIFSSISQDLQHYLIRLSLIEHWPLELLMELAPDQNLIQEMERIGSCIRYDLYLNAYRIHHLFLEYLKPYQQRLTEEEKQEVYAQAARWCAANNLKMDAISYYEKARAYRELIQLVYTFPLALTDPIAEFLLHILEQAPAEAYTQNASAYILYTRSLFTLGRFEECAQKLNEIIQRFEALPPAQFNYRVLCGCYNNLGFVGLISSLYTRRYDFVPCFEKGHYYYTLSNHELYGPVTTMSLGSYACWFDSTEKADLDQYLQAVSTIVPYISRSMNGCTYGMDDLIRAELAYFKGDIPNAERFVYQALYKARNRKQYEIETWAMFYLMRIHIYRGDYGAIQNLFKRLEAQRDIREYMNRYTLLDLVSGWFYIQIGQSARTAAWLTEDLEEGELHSLMYGIEILVQAKYYLAEKNYSRALDALHSQGSAYGPECFLFGKIEKAILEMLCRYHTAAPVDAIRALEGAYQLALPHALDMPFIEQGMPMALLAGTALKASWCRIPRDWLENIRRHASTYGKQLMIVAAQYQHANPEPLLEALSPREHAVLFSLSKGLTREQIAQDAVLSINTIKNTIACLYRKLGAVNRADAIRIAIASGLLQHKDQAKHII